MKKQLLYDLLVFDLDGTLADTREDIASAVNYVLRTFGEQELPINIIVSYVGDGVRELLSRAFPSRIHSRIEEAVYLFRSYYFDHLFDATFLYPGVRETLDMFPQTKKAVLSNKPEKHCKKLLDELKICDKFSYVAGGDTFSVMKPDAYPLEMICEFLKVSKKKTLMIGDGLNDVRSAQSAGVSIAAAMYGFTGRTLLEYNPDYVLENFSQLISIIEEKKQT